MKLAEIKKELDKLGYDIFNYDPDQLWQIEYGLTQNLDISKFANPDYSAGQMKEICIGDERGLNVELYSDRKFNKYQMRQMRIALEAGIDFKDFADPNISHSIMETVVDILLNFKKLGGEIKYEFGKTKNI